MANVKSTLTVEANGTTNSFTNTKQYIEEKITKYTLDEGDDTTEFYTMHSFSPATKTGNSSAAPSAFCIYNSGTTGAEVQFTTAAWGADAPDTATGIDETSYMTFLIGAGEMIYSNQLRLINYSDETSAGRGAISALALASDKVSTALTATSARGGDTTANVTGNHDASATALTLDNLSEKFRVGDYIFFDLSTDDVARVVSVDSATQITVERSVLGYDAQVIVSDSGTKDIYMYAGSHLHNKSTEDDAGVNIRTDANGRFKGMLLGDSGVVPRGSTAGTSSRGIVAGSVVIQFPEHGGYQNLGVNVSSTDSTGLATGATYAFRIQNGLGVATAEISFTTDSSDVSWGKVNSLINKAFSDANLDYKVEIVNGDVRFSATKWIDGDSVTLLDDADSSNEPWGVGNVPDTGAHESPVKTRFPTPAIVNVKSGKTENNLKHMLIDDGNGNLVGDVGSGTIDYDSGIVDFTGLYRAEFKTAFHYGSVHSGIPTTTTKYVNMVSAISGRSTNSHKEAELTLVIYS